MIKVFPICATLLASLSLVLAGALSAPARTITDMRGKQVTLPDKLSRVATIDDGFVEGVMTNLGVIDSVDMIGSWSHEAGLQIHF